MNFLCLSTEARRPGVFGGFRSWDDPAKKTPIPAGQARPSRASCIAGFVEFRSSELIEAAIGEFGQF